MPPASVSAKRRTAFTLIELLVVVAVIGVLAGLLLPALARGRRQAVTVECLSQQKQWGMALYLFAEDREGIIPRRGQGVRPLNNVSRAEDWFNALPPEMGRPSFSNELAALSAPASPLRFFGCPEAGPVANRLPLAYSMNLYLSPWNLPEPHRFADVADPSSVVFLCDGGVGYGSAFPAAAEYSPQPRHGGRVNLLFLDGHAEPFDGPSIGCNTGMVLRADVIWQFDTNLAAFGANQ